MVGATVKASINAFLKNSNPNRIPYVKLNAVLSMYQLLQKKMFLLNHIALHYFKKIQSYNNVIKKSNSSRTFF
jgi:hypothetical protein